MKKKTILACFVSICLLQSYCFAQDKSNVQFGKVSPADFSLPSSPLIDSSTNAVILSDVGSIHYAGNKSSWFSYVFKKQIRIKILNKKAIELATVGIPLYIKDDDIEKLDNLVASTYNLENGHVTEVKLDKKDIFDEREDKNHLRRKFTLPAVKDGSIIEYSYVVTSPYNFRIPDWEFQSPEYPSLWSEFEVVIPQALFYVFGHQGVHNFYIDKGTQGSANYSMSHKGGTLGEPVENIIVSATTVNHRWVMKDVPAFRAEGYLTTPQNFIDKIYFQLAKTYNGEEYNDYVNTWANATKELLKEDNFGGPLNDERDDLNSLSGKITADESGDLGRAKGVFYFVSSHFVCTNHYNNHIKTNFRDLIAKNSGTVGDINLLLVALLRKKGLAADPVILSTRDFGYNNSSYPLLSRLNYVIGRLKIEGKVYYLDAAHPELGFGQLSGSCYNGPARIISNIDSGSVYFNADSLKEKKTTLVMVSSTDKGLEGTYQSTLGQQESYNTRVSINKKGQGSYFKEIQTSFGDDLDISNTGIDSLTRLEDPIKVSYDFILKQSSGATLIYVNPLFADALQKNPFEATERKYPVEMPYVMDNTYIFSLQVPEGYNVDEMPKSAKVAFNVDEGIFEYLIEHQGDMVQLRCRVKLNKSYFPAEEYGSLRDFFAYVVKKESEQIVLKKK